MWLIIQEHKGAKYVVSEEAMDTPEEAEASIFESRVENPDADLYLVLAVRYPEDPEQIGAARAAARKTKGKKS